MDFSFANRTKNLSGTATREIFKLLSRPEIVSFAGGLPANEFLPSKDIHNITNELLSSDYAAKILQYGTTEGVAEFRQELIGYLHNEKISGLSADNLLIISGGQQGIDLVMRSIIEQGDTVLVENPTYLAVLQIIKSHGAEAIGVNADNNGLDINDLEQKIKKHKPKILYCVPTFSNPTGKTYCAENRKKIAQITAKYGIVVIEDDPYSKLRYGGEPIASLKSFDIAENIIYITSFSKVLSPALRVGVAAADEKIIRKMAIIKQGTDLHTASLSQYITLEYLKRGLLEKNLKKSIPVYTERKNAMISALKEYMPDCFLFNEPDGGLFVWGQFNADIDTGEYLKQAIEQNVAYIQGEVFYANPLEGKNSIRLNFSNEGPQRINSGIERLGKLYKKNLARIKL